MSTPARADFNIATGLKWVPLRYTAPVGAGSEGAATGTAGLPGAWYKSTAGDMYGWQSTSLDNYIAFFFSEQIGLQLSLDLGWGSHNTDNTMSGGNFSTSFFQFGLGVGAKFYLNRPTRERVSPYILLSLFKYFAAVSSNDPAVTKDVDVAGAIAAFRSPVGFDVAFGAEYFFTTSFSLGAEVLGMRFAHVDASLPIPMGRLATSENYFTLYTGISLNYRFLATASVHTYEEDEDRTNPRPRARKRRPAPPTRSDDDGSNDGNPPPPSPESVD